MTLEGRLFISYTAVKNASSQNLRGMDASRMGKKR
jgi:hypothetical protein